MNPHPPIAVTIGSHGRVRRIPTRRRRKASEFQASGSHPTVPVDTLPVRLGYLSVLVVDDDPANLRRASDMLAFWGIRAVEACSGREAVALVRELRLDLILMDLEMPKLDGLAASRQIRRLERDHARPRVPIVACRTERDFVASEALGQSGIDALIDKSLPAQALHDCLIRWCLPAARVAVRLPEHESSH